MIALPPRASAHVSKRTPLCTVHAARGTTAASAIAAAQRTRFLHVSDDEERKRDECEQDGVSRPDQREQRDPEADEREAAHRGLVRPHATTRSAQSAKPAANVVSLASSWNIRP